MSSRDATMQLFIYLFFISLVINNTINLYALD